MGSEGDASLDDFTFPVVADDSSLCQLQFHGLSSSPLWSPTHQPHRKSFSHGVDQRRLGSLVPTGNGAVWPGGYLDEEERMDMLWEHLNEELNDRHEEKKYARVSSWSQSVRRWEPPKKTSLAQEEDVHQVKSLKVSKRYSMNLNGKKSLMVIFKVFRKLLLQQKSNYSKKVS